LSSNDLLLEAIRRLADIDFRLRKIERLLPVLEEAFSGKIAPDGSLEMVLQIAKGTLPPPCEFSIGDMPNG
jgi:hypothetical protein